MSIIVEGLSTPYLVTLGYYGLFDDGSPIDTIDLDIENIVSPTDKYLPLTGVYSKEEDINGWRFDQRRVENWDLIRTRYNTFLGGHQVSLRDFTKLTHWQSGSDEYLKYYDIEFYRKLETLSWTPRVITGVYSWYWDVRKLYSDYSYSVNVNREHNENAVNVVALENNTVYSTLQAAIWQRLANHQIYQYKKFEQASEFTGKLESNNRLETINESGEIIYENLANRKNEFLVKDNQVIFNADHYKSIGWNEENIVLSDIKSDTLSLLWEPKGS